MATNRYRKRCYSDLRDMKTFFERFEYLKLSGAIGIETFGVDRYLNQVFYRSPEWKKVRDSVIIRDLGCDLGIEGLDIYGKIIVHHMNPIAIEDVTDRNPDIFNPEYLITVTHKTHNAIHYGDDTILSQQLIERKPNDMCPWKV